MHIPVRYQSASGEWKVRPRRGQQTQVLGLLEAFRHKHPTINSATFARLAGYRSAGDIAQWSKRFSRVLAEMAARGVLERVERGVYRIA